MIKINHCIFNNLEISNYKAVFITDVERGFSNNYEKFNTLAEAEKNKGYGPIYIAFELKK